MIGLNVTVEVSGLLAALRKLNPSADLTGVKAYLLDLALAESEPEPASVPQGLVHREYVPTQAAQEPQVEYPPALPPLPEGVIGKPVERKTSRVVVNRTVKGQDGMTDKERKRKELEALTSLDSKELLEKLIPTPRRGENNQVVNEGSDSASGGDLEIG